MRKRAAMVHRRCAYERRLTGDGSFSYFSLDYGEAFHSLSGALKEALERFVRPCRIPELARRGRVSIMDIGFGLGYNSAVSLHQAWLANPACCVEILGFEKDPAVLELSKTTPVPASLEEAYSIFRRLPKGKDPCMEEGRVSLTILLGPAEERIKEATGLFDAIFLDPFSPRKNPELWTAGFFREIKRLLAPGARLSTYSAATQVKLSFLEAGFRIGYSSRVGTKGMGILATLTGELPLMKPREMRKLVRRVERERGLRE